MRFQVAAAAVPSPEPKKDHGGRKLDEWKPRSLLQRHQRAHLPPGLLSYCAQRGFLCRIFHLGRLDQRLVFGCHFPRVNRHGQRRNAQVHVLSARGIEVAERNLRRARDGGNQRDQCIFKGGHALGGDLPCVAVRPGLKDLPFARTRCRRWGQTRQLVLRRAHGEDEFDGFADSDPVRGKPGWIERKLANGAGETRQFSSARQRAHVEGNHVRLQQQVLRRSARYCDLA